MRSITAFMTLGVVGLGPFPPQAAAQVFQPIGKQYRDVSAVLADIGMKSVVFKSVNAADDQLYYIPFFVFKADSTGKRPDVRIGASPNPGNKQVMLTLLLSPQNKLEAIAEYIRGQEKPGSKYADLTASRLIGVPIANIVPQLQ